MSGFSLEGKYLSGSVYCEFGELTYFLEEDGVLTKTIGGKITELGISLSNSQYGERDQVIFFGDSENVKAGPISIAKVFSSGNEGYQRCLAQNKSIMNVSEHNGSNYTVRINILDATGNFIDEIEKINFQTHTLEISFYIDGVKGTDAYFHYDATVTKKPTPPPERMTVHQVPPRNGWLKLLLGK